MAHRNRLRPPRHAQGMATAQGHAIGHGGAPYRHGIATAAASKTRNPLRTGTPGRANPRATYTQDGTAAAWSPCREQIPAAIYRGAKAI